MKINSQASIIPLIGSFAIAAENVTGLPTEYILTNKAAFSGNEQHYLAYRDYLGLDNNYYDLGESDFDSELTVNSEAKNVDLIVGVPPCSSLSGSNRQAGVKSGSGCHMYKFAEYVTKYIKPKLYVAENAPAFSSTTSQRGILTRKYISEIVEANGYELFTIKTNSAYFKVPQVRPRSYMVVVRKDVVNELPSELREANEKVYQLGSVHNPDINVHDFLAPPQGEPNESFLAVRDLANEYVGGLDQRPRNATLGALLKASGLDREQARSFLTDLDELLVDNEKDKVIKGLRTEVSNIYFDTKRGFGHYSPMLIGSQYTNTLFQQSVPMIFRETGHQLSQADVSNLMGYPQWFATADLGNYSDTIRIMTQSCPTPTNEVVLDFLLN